MANTKTQLPTMLVNSSLDDLYDKGSTGGDSTVSYIGNSKKSQQGYYETDIPYSNYYGKSGYRNSWRESGDSEAGW